MATAGVEGMGVIPDADLGSGMQGRDGDGNRVGTARGLRLPGILPEPGVIEPEGDELSAAERAVLADLDGALPPEDHDAGTAVDPGSLEPLRQERPRSHVPWWLGSLFFAAAGSASLGAAAMDGPMWRTLLFAAVGVVWFWMAWQSWRNRSTK
jgi:hypothetical protein